MLSVSLKKNRKQWKSNPSLQSIWLLTQELTCISPIVLVSDNRVFIIQQLKPFLPNINLPCKEGHRKIHVHWLDEVEELTCIRHIVLPLLKREGIFGSQPSSQECSASVWLVFITKQLKPLQPNINLLYNITQSHRMYPLAS